MSAPVDKRQTVFFAESRHLRTRRRSELLLFVAQRCGFLFDNEMVLLKQTCRQLRNLNFTSSRALRVELFTPQDGGVRQANLCSRQWHKLSQRLWSKLHPNSPRRPILSASSCVNLNIYWRTYNEKALRVFRDIIVCSDVAFNTPTAVAVIKVWEVFKKGQFTKKQGSLGTFVYLKFLGGNPNNLFSPNRVRGSARAITDFLIKDAMQNDFKGIYLEALQPVVGVFERIGFRKLDKETIEMGGNPLLCQPMIRLHDRADEASFKFS